jgi:hypothetical protein
MGEMLLAGELNERLPSVRDGLVAHYPFDGRGGCVDKVGIGLPNDPVLTNVNLSEVLVDWRNPDVWDDSGLVWDETMDAWKCEGYHSPYMKKQYAIPVDIYKQWYVAVDVYVPSDTYDGYRLYFGGDRLDADKNHLSGMGGYYDYSATTGGEYPARDLWVTYKSPLKTGTGDYYSGWGSDGCEYYALGGLFNYHGTVNQITYFRNVRFYYIDEDTSNITLLTNGIAVEEPTTNLLNNGDFDNDFDNWGRKDSYGTTEIVKDDFLGNVCKLNCIQSEPMWTYQDYSTSTHGTYTLSGMIKVADDYVSGNIGLNIYIYYDDGTNDHTLVGPDYTKTNVWQYLSITLASDTNKNITKVRAYAPWSDNLNGTFYGDKIQLERKPFATAFVDGSRSAGSLEIPAGSIDTTTTPFALNYWYAPIGSNQKSRDHCVEFVNFGKLWEYVPTESDSMDRRLVWDFENNGTRVYENLRDATLFVPCEYEMITVEWDTSEVIVYRNGVFWDKQALTGDCVIGTMDKIIFDQTNARIKDVSFYSNVLNDTKRKSLYSNKLSVRSTGDLVTTVKEPDNIIIKSDEQTKNVYDNNYKSIGTWSLTDYDVSDFVESDDTLGNTIVVLDVYVSSLDYVLNAFEYTKENNTKGFGCSVPSPKGGWKVGWNHVRFAPSGYTDAANTPWDSMDRLELYRTGSDTGVDTNQYLMIKNIQFLKYDDGSDIQGRQMAIKPDSLLIDNIREGETL